jgi:hypothetical protein
MLAFFGIGLPEVIILGVVVLGGVGFLIYWFTGSGKDE